ncbi:hypothetical protein DYD21_01615 [Rhodohalobacter sp. SW132]|uniref:flagellar basal body-associated FliL family protein n=1 Tax=Rhodohalobacter sp. SW132 TaxID=2293433 RepID=UPI000E24A864|nr:flagellar basal body-associated FliL family protein [Rhodohalobacter sp. SW132]REL38673.1 hypothetical protein DYD21_01615 [Rhodohalobacter sp. SW132]
MAVKKKKPTGEAKSKKKSRSKFLPLGKYFLILLVLASQVVLAYQIVDHNYGNVYQLVDGLFAPTPGSYTMEELVVNPAGSNGQRFLVVQVNLELRDEKHAELIEKNIQKVKHGMIEVLSSRTVYQLNTFEEREILRSELAEVTNNAIGVHSVRNLYYIRYVMQ